MFALKVLKDLKHPDGRLFLAGHECHQLQYFEMKELLDKYPKHFEQIPETVPPPIPVVRLPKPGEE